MALTDIGVRNTKPAEKPYKLADEKALFLLVTPHGAKYWRLKYRFDGREKSLAIGVYPDVTLAAARKARDEARELLRQNVDPSEQRKLDRIAAQTSRATTFRAVAEELLDRKAKEGKSEATLAKVRWLLIDLACPKLGRRSVAEISPAEVLAVLKSVEAAGKLETARRLRATIGEVFRLAIVTVRASVDPTAPLKGAIQNPIVKGRAAIIDPEKFGALLRAVDGHETFVVRKALQLSALLFQRPGELRLARWSEFNLDKGVWDIPAERMKMRRPHQVPLPPQALGHLCELRAVTGGGELCFPSTRSAKRPISDGTLNAALRRLGYAKTEASAHGFRTTASTFLNDSGKFSSDSIEAALAHADSDKIRGKYNKARYWDERERMARWWADHCDRLRSGWKADR